LHARAQALAECCSAHISGDASNGFVNRAFIAITRHVRDSAQCSGYAYEYAKIACHAAHFALAEKAIWCHMKLAFQASSPKTFKPGWQRPGFFCGGGRGAAQPGKSASELDAKGALA
jgi:hypothetical protein